MTDGWAQERGQWSGRHKSPDGARVGPVKIIKCRRWSPQTSDGTSGLGEEVRSSPRLFYRPSSTLHPGSENWPPTTSLPSNLHRHTLPSLWVPSSFIRAVLTLGLPGPGWVPPLLFWGPVTLEHCIPLSCPSLLFKQLGCLQARP